MQRYSWSRVWHALHWQQPLIRSGGRQACSSSSTGSIHRGGLTGLWSCFCTECTQSSPAQQGQAAEAAGDAACAPVKTRRSQHQSTRPAQHRVSGCCSAAASGVEKCRCLALSSLVALLMSDLWMWGITPPPAMVACTERPLLQQQQCSRPGCSEWASLTHTHKLTHRAAAAHLDEGVQLLVTANGELQVARRDTLHLRAAGRVQCPRLCARRARRPGFKATAAAAGPRALRSLEALPASSSTSAVRYSAHGTVGQRRQDFRDFACAETRSGRTDTPGCLAASL